MNRSKYFLIILIITTMTSGSYAQQTIPIIPLPNAFEYSGNTFTFPKTVNIGIFDSLHLNTALYISQILEPFYGKINIIENPDKAVIRITSPGVFDASMMTEGYSLKISGKKIDITANSSAGSFYAAQSLLQLIQASENPLNIPEVTILEKPEFKWRGVMIDCARHMPPISYLYQQVDWMSRYKLNTLHLHLTDDQGWRIEIKKFPKLTKAGSRRTETIVGWQPGTDKQAWKFDGQPYEGYYTQDELRQLVKYAAFRHVTIVPEIEMPGHSSAFLAAYPELASTTNKVEVARTWGIFEDIMLPTNETINALKDILDEVCSIFPSEFIHIGGDEAPKVQWQDNEYIHKLMVKENLTDVEQVQGWLNRKIEEHLRSKGKRLIGWDEILDGGISQYAAVMSWRGETGGIAAAKKGNDVVMSPYSNSLYWDHAQGPLEYEPDSIGRREGNATLFDLYNYFPVPSSLNDMDARHIMGVQANIWSEYIRYPKSFEYVTFPRILALAEVAWTNPQHKQFKEFVQRSSSEFSQFEKAGLNYRIPEPILKDYQMDDKYLYLTLFSPVKDGQIKWAVVNNGKRIKYRDFDGTIKIKQKAMVGKDMVLHMYIEKPDGKRSAPVSMPLLEL